MEDLKILVTNETMTALKRMAKEKNINAPKKK